MSKYQLQIIEDNNFSLGKNKNSETLFTFRVKIK